MNIAEYDSVVSALSDVFDLNHKHCLHYIDPAK